MGLSPPLRPLLLDSCYAPVLSYNVRTTVPVTATPAAGAHDMCCSPSTLKDPVLTPVSWVGQNILDTQATTIDGRPLLSKARTYQVTGGQEAILERQLTDANGNPINLSEICSAVSSASSAAIDDLDDILDNPDCPYQLKFRIREYLSLGREPEPAQISYPVDVINAETGIVRITLPAAATKVPGVYFGEVALVREEGGKDHLLFSNVFYVVIQRGMWSGKRPSQGPPTIAEVRLHLRDTDPEESFLLDNLAFSDAEIAMAIARPVQYWNEVPPPIGMYTTQTFPYRYHWLEGICGQLFLIVAEHQRRNNLQYSAAGVSVDDMNRETNYESASNRRWGAFREFVVRKKAEINLANCFTTFGSPYS